MVTIFLKKKLNMKSIVYSNAQQSRGDFHLGRVIYFEHCELLLLGERTDDVSIEGCSDEVPHSSSFASK
jgi:hypothetical protein